MGINMTSIINGIERFHLKANASFTIREGWLTKGLRHVHASPSVFLEDNAVDLLGVGSAMVKSIRFWMQATGLSTEPRTGRRTQTLTELGEVIYEHDLYFEDYFTQYIVHSHLVSDPSLATVWYLLFNHFDAIRFTRENMTDALLDVFGQMTTKDFSTASFRDDCGAALKTYVADQSKQASPEENMQCPLAALDLFAKTSKSTYERTIPPATKLHAMAVLYVIVNRMNGRESISLDKLLTEPCNVGKVFHLNAYRLNAYLDELQSNEFLTIQRTAGLNMVYPKLNLTPIEVVSNYYRR